MHNIVTTSVPTAHITIGKNRQRVYAGNRIFLDSGVEFEIELFNPTDKVILAKITINGTEMSNSGLVLNPGVRVFLDRHMNTEKRLKFETYEVEKNNPEVERAIANNGRIMISFYEEETNNTFYTGQYYDNFSGTGNIDKLFEVKYNDTSATYDTNYYNGTITTSGSINIDGTTTTSFNVNSINVPDTKETGRIDEGSKSDQVFGYVNKRFKLFSFHTVEYHLIPKSEKPVEVQDLRVYCTNCGTRRRNDNWKFCPKCGTKYE